MPVSKCAKKLVKISNGKLNLDEATDILKDTDKIAKSFVKKGYDDKQAISKAIQNRLENATVNIVKEKEKALLKVKKKVEFTNDIQSLIDSGMRVDKAFLSVLVGTQSHLHGTRNSIDLKQDVIASGYTSRLMKELEEEGLTSVLASEKFSREIARDLWELSKGNQVKSKNKEISSISQKIHKLQKDMVERMNKEGTDIEDINGFIVSQSHDVDIMRKAGRNKWKQDILPRLDIKKSFEGTVDQDSINEALDGAYEALITSIRHSQLDPKDEKLFQFSGPANLAKKRSSRRQLIFKSADDFMNYNDEYGRHTFNEALVNGIRNAAKDIALLEKLGDNPKAMIETVFKDIKLKNRSKIVNEGTKRDSFVQSSIELVTGDLDHSVNQKMTNITNGIKAFNNTRFLGGTIVYSVIDMVTKAFEYKFQGRNLLSSFGRTFQDLAEGFTSRQDKINFSSMTGVYAEQWIGDLTSRLNDGKNFTSKANRFTRLFFKLNGQHLWDSTNRTAFARTMSHDLALKSDVSFKNLDEDTLRIFGNYNINESDWDVIRKSKKRLDDGRDYITADTIENLQIADKLRGYFIDRTNHAAIQPTGYTKAMMTHGTKRGTLGGEFVTLIQQFKSFMYSNIEKAYGREMYAKGKADYASMAQLFLFTSMMGYIAMTARDLTRGKTPQDPTDPKTIFASIVKGGGLGIAGDLIFSNNAGFGRSFTDILAGPTFSSVNDIYNLYQAYLSGKDAKAQAFRVGIGLIPGQNIPYIREPLNHIMLYSIQEHLNPGYLKRMEKRAKEHGQDYFIKPRG